jgi:hypothetical protein
MILGKQATMITLLHTMIVPAAELQTGAAHRARNGNAGTHYKPE